ncbi:MAG TPA: DAK2 domain-containing protein [Pseudonocardiaceae bacterium]
MLQSLDAAAVRRWASTCCDELAARRDEIDVLNVFPVADKDTGSNLLATMRAGLDAVLREDGTQVAPGIAAAVLARGAIRGARGNSGVIVSQVLRGLAEAFMDGPAPGAVAGSAVAGSAVAGSGVAGSGVAGSGVAGSGVAGSGAAATLRRGLRRADELATAAVAEPVPGTVLTVLHAAADAAEEAASDDLAAVASAAAAAATHALSETPKQLGVLAQAGVVDAGGLGLVLLLEALVAVVTERPAQFEAAVSVPARDAHTLQVGREGGSEEYEYEVMYLLDGVDEAMVATLRAELSGLGDCVAVVGTGDRDPLWNVHVHCSDVGAAIEAGVRAGRPHRITVARFAEQEERATVGHRFVTGHAVLAMVSGGGVAELLRGEGAAIASATCGVTDLLAVLAGTRARQVTVLAPPGAPVEVAEAAAEQARDTGQDVVVVPTTSAVQALAAIAVHDVERRAADDLVAMTEAAAATRRGELTVADTEALTWAGRCKPGDVLGMVDDEVVLIATDPVTAGRQLVDRMLSVGGELVTLLVGADAPEGIGAALVEYLHSAHPEAEAVCYDGGQQDSMLLVGLE